MNKPIVITMTNHKGGVGKTTTASFAAFYLQKRGYKVLVVDMDMQGQARIYLADDPTTMDYSSLKSGNMVINQAREGIDLIQFGNNAIDLQYAGKTFVAFRKYLKGLDYDFIIVDNPPAYDTNSVMGTGLSDYVVIVSQTQRLSLESIERQLDSIEVAQKKGGSHTKLIGILQTLEDVRSKHDKKVIALAKKLYPKIMFDTVIQHRTKIKDMTYTGITDKLRADRKAIEQYDNFIEELLERIGVNGQK
jgi:chromosome partitioning protein